MPNPLENSSEQHVYDLFVIGGGINGCGIARDAAGRGYSVALAEMNDLASATSSASTKLFHGGLRYLEYFEIRLVREALKEREVLLRNMPHISWPMRFVLPYHKDMRFESSTPAAKLLSFFMPWMKGRRPAWMIRLGLFMYDHLGGREILPATKTLDLHRTIEGVPLQDKYQQAYEYSDCWIQDSRLVVLNARDAAARGAAIMTRTRVVSAVVEGDLWVVTLLDEATGEERVVRSRMVVNASGPWVMDVIQNTTHSKSNDNIRLVRGSHIVTRKLFEHDKCYFFQGSDGRIIFAIPYEQDFTLIGTTDSDHPDPDTSPECSAEEQQYLIDFASKYFEQPLSDDDVIWTYSGVRPLYNDGASSASAVTREYVLKVEDQAGAPLLNVFGGKITTYRKLAEAALEHIKGALPDSNAGAEWTQIAPLPGGDFPVGDVAKLRANLRADYRFLDDVWAHRLIRHYGTEAWEVLGDATDISDLGQNFGGTITEREVRWSISHEWTQSAEDFLWRRTRLGLCLDKTEIDALTTAIADIISSQHSAIA
ncbi:glycerol-3-phosphate dehydrogenase [Roseovarius sp. EL26]|uniref:glycerol-3-phosphate dehydrogenase n=1 Tax=Roseovarius sp. EL26 TaxID=2126672 RepID=UPI000EA38454|nr:glycerol-3-phosphate dehydrogenase [Roseovarius sp. EL26]